MQFPTPAWATVPIQNHVLNALFARATPADMKRRGWTREGGKGKESARWVHRAGWRLEHCGHPTALTPWLLLSPTGERILTGILSAEPNVGYGTAWKNLEMPARWVELAGEAYMSCRLPRYFYGRREDEPVLLGTGEGTDKLSLTLEPEDGA